MSEIDYNQQDIESVLREWEYDPENEEKNIRVIQGVDGKRKLQIRTYEDGINGISQMNADGRPDGKRPYNHEFAYNFYCKLACGSINPDDCSHTEFALSDNACFELIEESYMLYKRYVLFDKLGFNRDVIDDTEKDIAILDLVIEYANNDDDVHYATKQIIYPIYLNATKTSELEAHENCVDAVEVVIDALYFIDSLNIRGCGDFYIDKLESITKLAAHGITIGEQHRNYNEAIRVAKKTLKVINNFPRLTNKEFREAFNKEMDALEKIIKTLEERVKHEFHNYAVGYVFEDNSRPYSSPEAYHNAQEDDEDFNVGVSDEERAILTGASSLNQQNITKEQLSEKEALEKELEMAVVLENYEEAAMIRDKIKEMEK